VTQPIALSTAARTDAEVFLARLLRLDPVAVVRIQPAGAGLALWANLPWHVLACRVLPGTVDGDRTVAAAALRAGLSGDGPIRLDQRDADWRWALPPVARAEVADRVPAAELRRLADAAAQTLSAARTGGVAGRAVGSRAVRDALLDHVAITVEGREPAIPVTQRLIQGVVRMGFLGPVRSDETDEVGILVAGPWVALAARHGTVWHRPARTFSVRPIAQR
jgi:hypothetical protein